MKRNLTLGYEKAKEYLIKKGKWDSNYLNGYSVSNDVSVKKDIAGQPFIDFLFLLSLVGLISFYILNPLFNLLRRFF